MDNNSIVDLQKQIKNQLDNFIQQSGYINKDDIINITKSCISKCDVPVRNINVIVEDVEEYLKENYTYDNILNEYVDDEY